MSCKYIGCKELFVSLCLAWLRVMFCEGFCMFSESTGTWVYGYGPGSVLMLGKQFLFWNVPL